LKHPARLTATAANGQNRIQYARDAHLRDDVLPLPGPPPCDITRI
jgi:hypothetical protein